MKKGQTTSGVVVTVVVAIVAFLILGLFALKALGKETSEIFSQKTCHLSVLTRATVPDIAQAKIPLKCSADKICFTTLSNGKCTQFAGESNVQSVTLPSNDIDGAARLVERVSAVGSGDGLGRIDIELDNRCSRLEKIEN
jgi:hypothetical protein